MLDIKVPDFNTDFSFIVDGESGHLAAVILSYIARRNKYLPMFEFPFTTSENEEYNEEKVDEHSITRRRSYVFNIKVHNAIKRAGGCKYLILGNINSDQKSYLTFLDNYNVIEIDNVYEAEIFLSSIVDKNNFLSCREDDLLKALPYAVSNDLILKIENTSPTFIEINPKKDGLIVVETIERVSTVIAINYALSVNSQVELIPPLKVNHIDIKNLIKNWKDGDDNSFNDLSVELYNNIQDIDFKSYQYATFFTQGGPYSLILNNVIPITHVHLNFNPDFFIFNNIYFETNSNANSAVVFSPQEFKDEETSHVIKMLQNGNFYVKELIGKDASLYNIDYHVKQYPFDLLHKCSHGGEIHGHSIIEEFVDRNGEKHVIEYDEVLGFAFKKGLETVDVHSKNIWRKFDGVIWGSKEFKEKKIPHYIISDMINELAESTTKNRTYKDVIQDSCAIKCSDSIYQAMFTVMSISHCPIIFNNTCWSWSDFADSFLSVGVRCYIGTLWDINNNVAKQTAELFYNNLLGENISVALQKALVTTLGKRDENIYIVWGLPFSILQPASSINESKKSVTIEMLESLGHWQDRLSHVKKNSTKKSMEALIEWGSNEISTNFREETIEFIKESEERYRGDLKP